MNASPPEESVSVIVTTRNEGRDLERCLSSVRDQTFSATELIIVDNGSTDETVTIAVAYADKVLNFGPERSAQRNAGAREATGTYLLFLDADMELEKQVITEAVAAARAGAEVVVVPETSVGDGLWSRAKALERSCYEGDATIEAARFFLRTVFESSGGYDEALTGPEDWELPARLADIRIGRTSARIVHHEGRLTLRLLARKKFYYGKSFVRYIRLHPQLAARQLTIFRPAFFRNRAKLAVSPALTAAMLTMKVVEFAAGGAGMLMGVVTTGRP